jgi:chromatin remodeling complex protein RSC6
MVSISRTRSLKKEVPLKEKKVAATNSPKSIEKIPVVEVPEIVVAPVIDTLQVPGIVGTPVEEVEAPVESLSDRLSKTLATVSGMIASLKSVESELKAFKVAYNKEQKKNTKAPKRKTSSGNHGILEESKITPELAAFLNVDKDTSIRRPQVTKAIGNYVRENNLANPENKRVFKTDDNLKKILGEPRFLIEKKNPSLGAGFSYFNLQSYLKPHFVKK